MMRRLRWIPTSSLVRALPFALPFALAMVACGEPMRGIEFRDAEPAAPLAFTAHDGTHFNLGSEKGKIVLVYFGYTHCPDVCPTTMSGWARAKRALGDEAADVRWVFVSMDPDRDTPELAQQYAKQFDPSFIGLTGTAEEIDALERAWGISAYPEGDIREGNYTVAHPAHSFLVDRDGKLRYLYEPGVSGEDLAEDLRKLL